MIKKASRHFLRTQPKAPFFSWFKKKEVPKEEKPVNDEWDPKNWRPMGPVLNELKR
jgi:hypothetical protein